MRHTFTLLVAALGLTLTGCEPVGDKVPRADPTTGSRADRSSTTSAPAGDRTAAQEKLSTKLNELDAAMADLKVRAQRAGDKAKAEWEARRPQLEAQREAAAKQLDELKQSSKEGWTETRTKAEAAFGELEKGFKEAWEKLKE